MSLPIHPARPRAARHGFTLVELLVVIGIISVLISILLPALNRAREKAKQVMCLSNQRQLMYAIIMYTNNNSGLYPGVATDPPMRHDWIYWWGAPPYNNLADCALAPYLGKPPSPSTFRCPSDPWETHSSFFGRVPYQYSYSMNVYMGDGWVHHVKTTMVKRASEKILLVEEDERNINDGLWLPPVDGGYIDFISDRHDRRSRTDHGNLSGTDMGTRGNVAFCDGHGEFVDRRYAHDAAHYLPDR